MDIKTKILVLREPSQKMIAMNSFTFDGSTWGAVFPEQIAGLAYGLYEPIEWDGNGSPVQYRAVILIISENGAFERVPATPANVRIAAEIKRIKVDNPTC